MTSRFLNWPIAPVEPKLHKADETLIAVGERDLKFFIKSGRIEISDYSRDEAKMIGMHGKAGLLAASLSRSATKPAKISGSLGT